MHRLADFGAPALDRAAAAKGRNRSAEVLTEWDQKVVVMDPVPLRQFQPESHLGLLGSFGADVTPAIRDPMDMRVDADPRLFVADRHDKVGGLPANPIEAEECIEGIGNAPTESGEQDLADLPDGSGLGLVETDRVDCLGDL